MSYASLLGLHAEAHSRLHLRNFPQAFSHLALINAVVHLIEVDQALSARATLASAPDLGGGKR